MLTLAQVKKNPQIMEMVRQTEEVLSSLSYTDHGLRHADLVSDRARNIAKEVGLNEDERELAAIAAFCHDMGNFLSRTFHNYLGALLFHQIFQNDFKAKNLMAIMEAISNHDKEAEKISLTNPVSAIVILADKSDVHRNRVLEKSVDLIKQDIHDRVNYATTESHLKIDKKKKIITLTLKIDTNFVPIMEYFEIFTERMVFCRKAAQSLNYNFGLVINNIKLL